MTRPRKLRDTMSTANVNGVRVLGPDAIDRATPGRHVEVSAVKMPLSQPDGETSTTT